MTCSWITMMIRVSILLALDNVFLYKLHRREFSLLYINGWFSSGCVYFRYALLFLLFFFTVRLCKTFSKIYLNSRYRIIIFHLIICTFSATFSKQSLFAITRTNSTLPTEQGFPFLFHLLTFIFSLSLSFTRKFLVSFSFTNVQITEKNRGKYFLRQKKK